MSKLKKILQHCAKLSISCMLVFSFAGCPGGNPSSTPSVKPSSGTTATSGSASEVKVSGPGVVKGTVTKEGISGISTSGLSVLADETEKFPITDAPVYLDDLPTLKTKTDSKGYFEIKGIPTGDHYVVSEIVESGKTLKNRQKITIAQDNPTIDLQSFVLRKTGSITGMVSGAANPLGIDVFVPGTSMISKTKSTGAYGIINVAEGTYKVVASSFGYEVLEQTIEVKSGKSSNLDFALQKIDPSKNLATVKGKITTKTSQATEGLFGASISISGQSYVTLSDKDGNFTLANVPNGDYKLQIFRTGYKGLEVAVKVNVLATDATTKEITLKNNIVLESESENGIISGVIKTDKDEALSEVIVRLGGKFVLTDSNGAFIFENVDSGNWTLKFQKEGYKQVEQDVTVTKKATTKVNQTLQKEDFIGFISGKVIDVGDNAVTSASIYITETSETKSTSPIDGTFKLTNMKAGTYTLLVTKDASLTNLGTAKFMVEVKDKNIEGIVVTLYTKLNPDSDKDNDSLKNREDTWPYDPTNDSVLAIYPLDADKDADGDKVVNSQDKQPFDPTNDSLDGGVNINSTSGTPTVIPSAAPSAAGTLPIKSFYFETTNVSTVKKGETITLYTAIEYEPILGIEPPKDISNANMDWTSSDSTIATVAAKGYVTGVKAGTITITATCTGNISADKKVITKSITVTE